MSTKEQTTLPKQLRKHVGSGDFDALTIDDTASDQGRSLSRHRLWAARAVALVADAVQLAVLPLVLEGAASPLEAVIDIVTAGILTGLLGFRWAFLPTFVAELVPFVDLAPSWTLAVFITTRDRRREPK